MLQFDEILGALDQRVFILSVEPTAGQLLAEQIPAVEPALAERHGDGSVPGRLDLDKRSQPAAVSVLRGALEASRESSRIDPRAADARIWVQKSTGEP